MTVAQSVSRQAPSASCLVWCVATCSVHCAGLSTSLPRYTVERLLVSPVSTLPYSSLHSFLPSFLYRPFVSPSLLPFFFPFSFSLPPLSSLSFPLPLYLSSFLSLFPSPSLSSFPPTQKLSVWSVQCASVWKRFNPFSSLQLRSMQSTSALPSPSLSRLGWYGYIVRNTQHAVSLLPPRSLSPILCCAGVLELTAVSCFIQRNHLLNKLCAPSVIIAAGEEGRRREGGGGGEEERREGKEGRLFI